MSPDAPEYWLRGRIDGFEPLLMPIVHALLQVREDLGRLTSTVPQDHTWARPGKAASIGFHVRHTGGALDRLFTYARGEALTDEQKLFLKNEGVAGDPEASLDAIVAETDRMIDRALEQLRATDVGKVLEERKVGRAGLPATTLGLLFHAAEHCTRHVGQAITTAKALQRD